LAFFNFDQNLFILVSLSKVSPTREYSMELTIKYQAMSLGVSALGFKIMFQKEQDHYHYYPFLFIRKY